MKRKWLAYPYILWMLLFIVAPMLMIAYYAFFTKTQSGGEAVFTWEYFAEVFAAGGIDYLGIFGTSLLLAFICTVICLAVAYPVSYFIADKKLKIPTVVVLLFMMPMWMNFLLRTYATMNLLSGIPLLDKLFMNNHAGVLLGMVYNYLPFMILPIYSALSKMDTSLIEAAGDLGASPAACFRKVVLPLSMPGVISGITMVFMPAVSTFAVANLLGGGKVVIIGDVIQKYFGSLDTWGWGAALSLLLMVLIIVSLVITNLVERDKPAARRKKNAA